VLAIIWSTSAIVAPWVKAQICGHTAVGFPNMTAA
jgi:hypothetical protein